MSAPSKNSMVGLVVRLLFSTEGRIGRAAFLSGFALINLVALVPIFIVSLVLVFLVPPTVLRPSAGTDLALSLVAFCYLVFAVWSGIALIVKRLHDAGKSGMACLLMLVPMVNFLLLIVLAVGPGTEGENSYGPEPSHWMEITTNDRHKTSEPTASSVTRPL